MSTSSDYYLAQADACARDAAATTLENVRERCLRSEAAWRAMAQRQLRSDAFKQADAERKAATVDSEAVI